MNEKRVVWTNPDGSVSVLIPAPGVDERVWRKDIPAGVEAIETTIDKLPKDRLFRSAWRANKEAGCFECPVKSKEVAHELRRAKRAKELEPLDQSIAIRLPGKDLAVVEGARQAIRDKHARIQNDIDSCTCVEDLRNLIAKEKLV